MKKIFIYVHACDRRGLDASKVRKYLIAANYEIVDRVEDADVILLFTCATLEYITKESLKKVKQFQKYNAELIIAGCLPAIEKEKLAKIFDGKTIITKDINSIKQLFPDNEKNISLSKDANIVFRNINVNGSIRIIKKTIHKIKPLEKIFIRIKNHMLKNLFGENSLMYRVLDQTSYFFIRISSGCLGNCAYCAIKKAIGTYKSKAIDQCVSELNDGIKKGYKHFVLDADDTGAYGLDIESNFPELVDKLTDIPGYYQISIRNLHPKWIVKYIDDLEQILKKEKIVSIESPIQTGSSRILKLMNRYSDTQKIMEAYHRLQKAYPEISLSTHYLMGFPSETDEDFLLTMDYIKKINFSAGNIIPYELKVGTISESIEPKISKEQRKKWAIKAKKFLKNCGYDVIYFPRSKLFIFENSSYRNG